MEVNVMSKKRKEIITQKVRSFTWQSALLLTILSGLFIAAVMGIIGWQVVLIGGVLVIVSTVGDLFSLGASVLFRYVMLPASMKRKNDRSAYFEDDYDEELVAGNNL
jgi:hypothetical protein